jgi:hypothetical protein
VEAWPSTVSGAEGEWRSGGSHCQDHGSPRAKRAGFGEHHQQTFTTENTMTAHARILSCIAVTSRHFDVTSFTFAFRRESRPYGDELRMETEHTHMFSFVRLEVFTALTVKNGIFLDVTPCGSCRNRRFGGT